MRVSGLKGDLFLASASILTRRFTMENGETANLVERGSRLGQMAGSMTETGRWANLSAKDKRFTQMERLKSDGGMVLNSLKDVRLI
jgi:hypothetical protein